MAALPEKSVWVAKHQKPNETDQTTGNDRQREQTSSERLRNSCDLIGIFIPQDSSPTASSKDKSMPRILLTAFEPVDQWRENSSWLTLIELTRWFEANGQVVTRRYPSDVTEMTRRLTEDLRAGFDIALHLGQSPGTPTIQIESTGQNRTGEGQSIVAGVQPSYRSLLPLASWAERLQAEGIPTNVSHQPATSLGNVTLFLSHHIAAELDVQTQCCFIHLPVAPHQVCENMQNHGSQNYSSQSHGAQNYGAMASMSLPMMAYGISIILKQLMETAGD